MSVFILLDSAKHLFTKKTLVHHLQMQTEWESGTVHNGWFISRLPKSPDSNDPQKLTSIFLWLLVNPETSDSPERSNPAESGDPLESSDHPYSQK